MREPDLTGIDLSKVPTHIGVIMDGNGRWAHARGLERTAGHAAGEAALFDTVEGALAAGVGWLTAYTFSTENWSRDPAEVEFLMFFHEDLLTRRRDELHAQGVRMLFLGEMGDPRIPERNHLHMAEASELTKDNDRLNLVLAFNYGGRAELTAAARRIAGRVAAGVLDPAGITEATMNEAMHIPEMPPVDLLIRTSGERRTSNFLPWQAAYAELLFVDTLWPDFGAQAIIDAIAEYQRRERRFGIA